MHDCVCMFSWTSVHFACFIVCCNCYSNHAAIISRVTLLMAIASPQQFTSVLALSHPMPSPSSSQDQEVRPCLSSSATPPPLWLLFTLEVKVPLQWPMRLSLIVHPCSVLLTKVGRGSGEMAHQVKALVTQAWQPQFQPQNLHKGGRRDPTPQSCPLTSTCTLWHVCPTHIIHTDTHTTIMIK